MGKAFGQAKHATATKHLRELKAVAAECGVEFAGVTRNSHYKFQKGKHSIFTGSTPTDPDTALKNFRRDCERA